MLEKIGNFLKYTNCSNFNKVNLFEKKIKNKNCKVIKS